MVRLFISALFVAVSLAAVAQKGDPLTEKFNKLQEKGETEKAIKVLQKISERNAEVYFAFFSRADKLYAQHNYALAAGSIDDALELHSYPLPSTEEFVARKRAAFAQGITVLNGIMPHDSSAVNLGNRATLKEFLGQYAEAVADYTSAIALDPANFMSFYNRGCAYNHMGLLEEAYNDFSYALELNENLSGAYLNRGFVQLKLEQYDGAIDDFRWMLGTNPEVKNRAFCYNNMGYAYLKLGEIGPAKENVNESVRLLPTNPYAYRNLALISIEEEDFTAACEFLSKSLALGFTETYGNEVLGLQEKYCR